MALQYGGVVGTGISSPSALLVNTLDAIAQKKIAPYLSDIVLKPSPTHWALQRSGKHITGAELVFPLLTQEEATGGAFWGDQLLNTAVIDSITPANQVWRAYYQSCAIPTLDVILGSGVSAIDVVKAKMQVCAASLLPKLARANWGVAPNNSAIDIDNIPAWIGTQNNTIAGINRSTTTAWNPASPVSNTSGPLTVPNAEKLYQSLVFGYDEPDTLVLNNYDYGNFKTQFTSNSSSAVASIIRSADNMSDREAVQTSIRYHFRFNNCVVLADQYVTAGTGWMWNSKYMWMNYHSKGYYIIRPWLMSSNQEVVSTRVVVVEQLTNVNPRTAGTITNLT